MALLYRAHSILRFHKAIYYLGLCSISAWVLPLPFPILHIQKYAVPSCSNFLIRFFGDSFNIFQPNPQPIYESTSSQPTPYLLNANTPPHMPKINPLHLPINHHPATPRKMQLPNRLMIQTPTNPPLPQHRPHLHPPLKPGVRAPNPQHLQQPLIHWRLPTPAPRYTDHLSTLHRQRQQRERTAAGARRQGAQCAGEVWQRSQRERQADASDEARRRLRHGFECGG